MRHKDIVGTVAEGRQGLGTSKSCYWNKANAQERRNLVQREIKCTEEENRQTKLVEIGSQGAWSRWDTEQRSITWSYIWKYPQFQLQFLLRSVYDVLPTTTNLHKWKLTETLDCPLCGARRTLQHILSSCAIALSQGRYTWRHNNVLWKMADVIEKQRREVRTQKKKPTQIQFVKEGETPRVNILSNNSKSGILDQAEDWQLEVDMDSKLRFPEVVPTNLRPGMFFFGRQR